MLYLLIIASILLFLSGFAGFLAAPYVPTRKKDVARFLELAQIKKGDIVYDLGCGDGRILKVAKKKGARAIGFELSVPNYLFCRLRGIKMRFKNFFKADFKDADIVYMFLSKKAHNKMGKILQGQMKKGSKVICYVWPIEVLTPEKIDKLDGSPNMYLYRL
ncbi:methionine biosynthesis protein MetW [Candidatus Parcubacteria bacterium]|nr:methionine biosynthesis protein MetW [Patescibacteria group bacterium]MCG2693669.1 methionine biosynthesis protein MetW [Candidatus Parcubacteria bacterium]